MYFSTGFFEKHLVRKVLDLIRILLISLCDFTSILYTSTAPLPDSRLKLTTSASLTRMSKSALLVANFFLISDKMSAH
jgi:hypothetical protein